MHETTVFPRPGRNPGEVFSGATLRLLTSRIMGWRQGPGAFGGLHLHPCWEEIGVISRRYHGETTFTLSTILRCVMKLADRSGGGEWRELAGHIAAQLLWLKIPEGGFIHADFQYEPAYSPAQSCPIHQMLPAWALTDYAAWKMADPLLCERIPVTLREHFSWFQKFWWGRGNALRKPLPFAGWCGVTNQDFTAIAAYCRFGQVFGDWSWYERFAAPALKVYLSPLYFQEEIGQFERGDRPDFFERPSYLAIIENCLDAINRSQPDARVASVLKRLRQALFDTVIEDEHFGWMLAWGGDVSSGDHGKYMRWNVSKAQISCYPEVLAILEKEAATTGSAADQQKVAHLEGALAAWVFADGTIPATIGAGLPILAAAEASVNVTFWLYLIERCAMPVEYGHLPDLPVIERRVGDVTFHQHPDWWRLVSPGTGDWTGYKKSSGTIFPASEPPPNLPAFPESLSPQVREEVILPQAK